MRQKIKYAAKRRGRRSYGLRCAFSGKPLAISNHLGRFCSKNCECMRRSQKVGNPLSNLINPLTPKETIAARGASFALAGNPNHLLLFQKGASAKVYSAWLKGACDRWSVNVELKDIEMY